MSKAQISLPPFCYICESATSNVEALSKGDGFLPWNFSVLSYRTCCPRCQKCRRLVKAEPLAFVLIAITLGEGWFCPLTGIAIIDVLLVLLRSRSKDRSLGLLGNACALTVCLFSRIPHLEGQQWVRNWIHGNEAYERTWQQLNPSLDPFIWM